MPDQFEMSESVGVLAAPFGARIAQRVNPDRLLTFVGLVVTASSAYGLYRALS